MTRNLWRVERSGNFAKDLTHLVLMQKRRVKELHKFDFRRKENGPSAHSRVISFVPQPDCTNRVGLRLYSLFDDCWWITVRQLE